jgi:hypothetical protein
MSTSGEIPVIVTLTRDQIGIIRGALALLEEISPEWTPGVLPMSEIFSLQNVFNLAENQASFKYCPRCGKSLLSHSGYCGMDM